MESSIKNATVKTRRETEFNEIDWAGGKNRVDLIDVEIWRLLSMSQPEIDYAINYDIKICMDKDLERMAI